MRGELYASSPPTSPTELRGSRMASGAWLLFIEKVKFEIGTVGSLPVMVKRKEMFCAASGGGRAGGGGWLALS